MLSSTVGWAGGALLSGDIQGKFEGQFYKTMDGVHWTLDSSISDFYPMDLSVTGMLISLCPSLSRPLLTHLKSMYRFHSCLCCRYQLCGSEQFCQLLCLIFLGNKYSLTQTLSVATCPFAISNRNPDECPAKNRGLTSQRLLSLIFLRFGN